MPTNPDNHTAATRFLRRGNSVARLLRRCRLQVAEGPDAGRQAVLGQRRIAVGSRADCDFVLNDKSVSGHHLEIELDDRGFVLRDLGSTNGTFIGPVRVGEVTLDRETRIGLGESVLVFTPLGEEEEQDLPARDRLGGLLGRSPPMQELFATIEQVAPSDATVLITGETGTGKELVAETIHNCSRRAQGPFVVVDCTAVPATLFESELFGHERGAFTGAVASHRGAFERAGGGTLFLDEISELELSLQPKLLRALERRRVQPVGATRPVDVDVRIVAACRRELADEVRRGAFRDDLYYRLAVVRLQVPPLRKRREDIALLASSFIGRARGSGEAAGEPADLGAHLSPDAIDRLLAHDWPGNVRELRNAIERAAVLETDPLDGAEAPAVQSGSPADGLTGLPFQVAKKKAVDDFERGYLEALLDQHDQNVTRCAKAAGMDRRNFQRLLRRHDLGREDQND